MWVMVSVVIFYDKAQKSCREAALEFVFEFEERSTRIYGDQAFVIVGARGGGEDLGDADDGFVIGEAFVGDREEEVFGGGEDGEGGVVAEDFLRVGLFVSAFGEHFVVGAGFEEGTVLHASGEEGEFEVGDEIVRFGDALAGKAESFVLDGEDGGQGVGVDAFDGGVVLREVVVAGDGVIVERAGAGEVASAEMSEGKETEPVGFFGETEGFGEFGEGDEGEFGTVKLEVETSEIEEGEFAGFGVIGEAFEAELGLGVEAEVGLGLGEFGGELPVVGEEFEGGNEEVACFGGLAVVEVDLGGELVSGGVLLFDEAVGDFESGIGFEFGVEADAFFEEFFPALITVP